MPFLSSWLRYKFLTIQISSPHLGVGSFIMVLSPKDFSSTLIEKTKIKLSEKIEFAKHKILLEYHNRINDKHQNQISIRPK